MQKVSIILMVAAGLITAINIGCLIAAERRHKNVLAWSKTIEDMHKLREYQKGRMCDNYCKYKETAETQEELDWKCQDCPVGQL